MLLRDLSQAMGPSGYEKEVRDIIKNAVSTKVDSIFTDSMGNLICYKKGKKTNPKKIMVAAHMDEVGFIITKVEKEGFLRFQFIGGFDQRILLAKKVLIGENKIKGIIGNKAVHLTSLSERNNVVDAEKMYIDIGCNSKEEALKLVNIADPVVFDSDFIEFGENMIKGKALDDRVGCSIMVDLMDFEYEDDIYFSFTVQEEIGLRGAKTASYTIEPDYALILEGTTCADITGVNDQDMVTKVNNGSAISIMDRTTIYKKDIINKMTAILDRENIKYQYRKNTFGGNDAGSISLSKTGVICFSAAVPCRYIHSPVSVMSLNDYKSCFNLSKLFLENISLIGGQNE